MLAAKQRQANSSVSAYDRFRQQPPERRGVACEQLQPRGSGESAAFLAAALLHPPPSGRTETIWEALSRLLDKRGVDAGDRDQNILASQDTQRQRAPDACHAVGALPLWRGGRLCRRHRFCGYRRRTLCRSCGGISFLTKFPFREDSQHVCEFIFTRRTK